MVSLTRLDGNRIIVHATHIVTVESTPNTLVRLHNGDRLMVQETTAELVARVASWSRQVLALPPHIETANAPHCHEAR